MAYSCDVVRNFVAIMFFCYWLGKSAYILGNSKGNFMLGRVHYLLGNSITKPIKQILPLSILFVSPYDNTSFVCIGGGVYNTLDGGIPIMWCVKNHGSSHFVVDWIFTQFRFSIITLIKIKVSRWVFDFSHMLELPYKDHLNLW